MQSGAARPRATAAAAAVPAAAAPAAPAAAPAAAAPAAPASAPAAPAAAKLQPPPKCSRKTARPWCLTSMTFEEDRMARISHAASSTPTLRGGSAATGTASQAGSTGHAGPAAAACSGAAPAACCSAVYFWNSSWVESGRPAQKPWSSNTSADSLQNG